MCPSPESKIKAAKPIPPEVVPDGPVMQNVMTGSDVDLWKFPVLRSHAKDGGRYIGTADHVINRDPESGGLIVWDVPAPLDWGFAKYNDDAAAARNFLAQAGARSVTVPHRANRAVIFDSDLFHETDRIAFREGYLNRRINITLLYGRREAAAKEGGGT